MMNIHDAYTLAVIKLKTRKGRTLFAAFSASIGIICILTFAFATYGLTSFVHDVFPDRLSDRYFAVDTFNNQAVAVNEEAVPTEGSVKEFLLPEEALSPDAYKKKYPEVTQAFRQIQSPTSAHYTARGDGDFGDFATLEDARSYVEPLFAQDFVEEGYTFENKINDCVPVLFNQQMLLPEGAQFAFFGDSAKERYDASEKSRKIVVGKTYTVTDPARSDADSICVIVVGVVSDSVAFSNQFVNGQVIYPLWAVEESFLSADQRNPDALYRIISEFSTKDVRDEFVRQHSGLVFVDGQMTAVMEAPSSYVSPAETPRQQVDSIASFLRGVSYSIGGFFLAVSSLIMMTTLGKIITDSKKEIAVFRAVGATIGDIRKMYYMHVLLLSSAAFVIGTCGAIILDIVASKKWGDSIFYTFISFASSATISKPYFLLLSFDPRIFVLLHIVTIFVGLLASFFPIRRASKVEPIQVLREL